ncbi:hypothetical protein NDU88_006230 [Pleurodeles waltl]|uniref:Uncharacterized protein n=1 Tax=Pleurodeles waltl TaxID=8319 RepID=A0AAV7RKX1_PLEWA|nr:hypothetical protein NDU88_006230 [Pleurodeles waltl]
MPAQAKGGPSPGARGPLQVGPGSCRSLGPAHPRTGTNPTGVSPSSGPGQQLRLSSRSTCCPAQPYVSLHAGIFRALQPIGCPIAPPLHLPFCSAVGLKALGPGPDRQPPIQHSACPPLVLQRGLHMPRRALGTKASGARRHPAVRSPTRQSTCGTQPRPPPLSSLRGWVGGRGRGEAQVPPGPPPSHAAMWGMPGSGHGPPRPSLSPHCSWSPPLLGGPPTQLTGCRQPGPANCAEGPDHTRGTASTPLPSGPLLPSRLPRPGEASICSLNLTRGAPPTRGAAQEVPPHHPGGRRSPDGNTASLRASPAGPRPDTPRPPARGSGLLLAAPPNSWGAGQDPETSWGGRA